MRTILSILVILGWITQSSAQGLSGLMDAINKLDKKLTAMISKEAAARKAEDAKIKKALGAQAGAGADTALKADVENLIKAVNELKSARTNLSEEVETLSKKIDETAAKGDDARVKAMVGELKTLLEELKKVVAEKQKTEEKEDDGKEAMDVGGLVSLDYGAPVDGFDEPGMELGEVELAANVYLSENLTATVALLAEGDLSAISIDQALAAYESEKKPVSFIFGQQYYNHGLLSTHLISDPLVVGENEDVFGAIELANPGLTIAYGVEKISLGAALTIFIEEEELGVASDGSDSVISEGVFNHAGIFNADYEVLEESPLRVSALMSQEVIDFDLAATVAFAGLAFDLEGFTQVMAPEDAMASGFFVGLAYGASDMVELAARFDAVSGDSFEDMDTRIGGGLSVSLPHDLFCALEIAHSMPNEGDAATEIALQLGLESTIKLPGFQRRTLTRN